MSAVISIRIDEATKARLREMGERHGWTEGQTAKYLIETGLGADPEGAVLNHTVWKLSAGLNRGMANVLARLREILEEELDLDPHGLVPPPEGSLEQPEDEFEEPTPVIGSTGRRRRRGRRGGRS
jgi:hypothetical protein